MRSFAGFPSAAQISRAQHCYPGQFRGLQWEEGLPLFHAEGRARPKNLQVRPIPTQAAVVQI